MYAKNGYAQSSFQRYRAVKIQTASPAQILIMLYDGAIRFALIARKKIDEKDYAAKGTYIGKVQAIISELMSSLDFSIAPELCAQLEQLYIYMMEQLTEANLKLDTQALDTVVRLLKTLREGWNEALTSLPSDPTAGRETTARAPKQLRRPGAPPAAGPAANPSDDAAESAPEGVVSARPGRPVVIAGRGGPGSRPKGATDNRPQGGLSTRTRPPGSRQG